MSMNGSSGISGLLASVCLISMLACTASFAQDAVLDAPVFDDVVVDDTPVILDPAPDAVVDTDVPAAEVPMAFAEPVANDASNGSTVTSDYEPYSDEVLATEHTYVKNIVDGMQADINGGRNDEKFLSDFDYFTRVLLAVDTEIERRKKSVVPVVAKPAVKDDPWRPTTEKKPSRAFCKGLLASGNHADCGWAFKHTS